MLVVTVFIFFVEGLTFSSSSDELVVNTTLGLIRGMKIIPVKGTEYYAFRGIRYAQPPLGNLRFKPPEPIEPWDRILNATEYGHPCHQTGYPNSSEDCLNLNIYTRKIDQNITRPVLVLIHTGSVIFPGHITDWGTVLVTVNYRFDLLGFFSTGDKYAPGNNGLKDQVMALKWVKNNIRFFGGDPASITLAGYGIGGALVSFHLVSPMSRGLFQRAMIFSGSALNLWSPMKNPLEVAKKQADFYGCPSDTSENISNCICKLPVQTIEEKMNALISPNSTDWYNSLYPTNAPVIETGDHESAPFLTKDPVQSFLEGDFANVPIFIGTTKDEMIESAEYILEKKKWSADLSDNWTRLAPLILNYKRNDTIGTRVREYYFKKVNVPINNDTVDDFNNLLSDRSTTFGVLRSVKLLSEKNTQPVYLYQFNYVGKDVPIKTEINRRKIVGHGHDMLYVLRDLFFYTPGADDLFINKYRALWKNFIETGNPTPGVSSDLDNVTWIPYTNEHPTYLDINEILTLKEGIYNEERISFWESIFPMNYSRADE